MTKTKAMFEILRIIRNHGFTTNKTQNQKYDVYVKEQNQKKSCKLNKVIFKNAVHVKKIPGKIESKDKELGNRKKEDS